MIRVAISTHLLEVNLSPPLSNSILNASFILVHIYGSPNSQLDSITVLQDKLCTGSGFGPIVNWRVMTSECALQLGRVKSKFKARLALCVPVLSSPLMEFATMLFGLNPSKKALYASALWVSYL